MRWLALLLAGLPLAAAETRNTDDFAAYPAGSDGSPAWSPNSVGFEMLGGAYHGDSGASVWERVPFASALTFTCDLTVLAQRGTPGDFLTAGIGVFADDDNYWALLLTASPEATGRRHSIQLHERLNGVWLAQTIAGTRLTATASRGGDFAWQLGHAYQLEVQLTAQGIAGWVRDGGAEVAHFGYAFARGVKAVTAGRPGLRLGGVQARFDHAAVVVSQTAPEPAPARFPPWVSRDAPRLQPGTGFFATALVDGRWWLVDPEGKAWFSLATDHCRYVGHRSEKLGFAPYGRTTAAKYGSEEAWAQAATDRLKAWGFNSLAAGAGLSTYHRGLAHILFAGFGGGFARLDYLCQPLERRGFPNVFNPRWERYCRLTARRLARQAGTDPWCVGTFLDNELEWYGKKGYLVDEIFGRPAGHTAKQALWDWLVARYGDTAGVNRALGTRYAGAPAFQAATTVPPASPALHNVRDRFLEVIAERYFGVACRALREADPHHLVLGCRFATRAPTAVLDAAGRYNDVFTINTYPRVDLDRGLVLDAPRQLAGYYERVRKPFVITEWSFPALDSGLPCRYGAGMRVDTQAQKARCYQIYADTVASLPFVAGYHYFMWVDEPAEGISSIFPEDSNYGLVNAQDEPYAELVAMAAKVNRAAFARHQASVASGDLALTAAASGFAVRNPAAVDSSGMLTWGGPAGARTEALRLAPGAVVRRAWPAGGGAAVLRRWDGTSQQLTHLPPGVSPGVLNTGDTAVATLPVAADGPVPRAAVLTNLPAGAWRAVEPTPWAEAGAKLDRLTLAGGPVTWVCDRRGGALFDPVRLDDLEVGRITFALHQRLDGRDVWAETDTVEAPLTIWRRDGLCWINAVVANRGAAQAAAARPARYRAGVQAVVFEPLGLALVRPLWVESLDERPWELVDALFFCTPSIGGSPADDVRNGPDVRNYYLRRNHWTDPQHPVAFGATSTGVDWSINYFTDAKGVHHPDAHLAIGRRLPPSERWEAGDGPYLWVAARRDVRQWPEVEALARAAGQVVMVQSGAAESASR